MAQQSTRAFGMPLAAFQLIRHRLSRILTDITDMLSMQYRLSQLLDEGDYSMPRVAPAKMHDTERARGVLADAATCSAATGSCSTTTWARHLCDIEAIDTYEGTATVQALIGGGEIPGIARLHRGEGGSHEQHAPPGGIARRRSRELHSRARRGHPPR
ncbi:MULTISPECIES: acyl-CoA dehydrogenase family protein [unclassified Streptomyces]|uniref:acyl-CoA dehydrogenase family protein n=1 Tax=unclassified Streptomyces TaxID=2593676 RepID=UPI0033AB1122